MGERLCRGSTTSARLRRHRARLLLRQDGEQKLVAGGVEESGKRCFPESKLPQKYWLKGLPIVKVKISAKRVAKLCQPYKRLLGISS